MKKLLDRQREILIYIYRERERARERERQTGRQAGRQTDRRTDTQTCAHMQHKNVPFPCLSQIPVEAGVNFSAPLPYTHGSTPAHYAAGYGQVAALRFLKHALGLILKLGAC